MLSYNYFLRAGIIMKESHDIFLGEDITSDTVATKA